MPEGALLAYTTDPISQGIVGVVIVAVFTLLTIEAAHRVLVVMTAVAVLLLVTYLTPFHLITLEGIATALDNNVLILLAAMMAVVGVLKTTGIFESAVGRLMARSGGQPIALLGLIIWFTALASAFLDNVTTVVFVTPMVLAAARLARLPAPVLLLPMVMASNIGGTATLIGDPPNIMIGSGANLSFLSFMEHLTVPCLVMLLWLGWFTRRYYASELATAGRAGGIDDDAPPIHVDPLLMRWMAGICVVILVGFLTHHLTGMPAAVPALVGAAAALVVQDVLYVRRYRPTSAERQHGILHITAHDIEWPTLAFFGFLFIVVGAAINTGLIATMAEGLQWSIRQGAAALGLGPIGTLVLAAILICWVSGILSALIDNIPFVAVAIPIVASLTASLQGPSDVLWWSLALGACLGGNGSVIGASANVTTVGLAEKAGVRVSFREFGRYAIPVTAGTLVIASAYLVLRIAFGNPVASLVLGAIFLLGIVPYVIRRPAPQRT